MTMQQFTHWMFTVRFSNILTMYRLEKFDKLQMATAQKLIAKFLSNLQHSLLIPIGISTLIF